MNEPLPEYLVAGEGHRTLVFLHGLGGDHTNWQPQFAEFSADYRCVAWTLPGYGASPPMSALTWPNLSDMLVRVLDDVGVEQVTVIGLSMGGFIAQQFAADHDDRVEQVVLAGTTAQFGRGSKSFIDDYLKTRLEPLDDGDTPADFAPAVVKRLLSKDVSAETMAIAVSSMSRISPEAYRDALECLVTWNFVDYLDEIEAPALCIAARDDVTAPVAALEALAERLPNARLEVIDNCQHLMNLDRPTEFNALVRRFLEEL